MPWLKAAPQKKSKDIPEMSGRKAIPLRALIVEMKEQSFKLGGTAYECFIRPCRQYKGEFFYFFQETNEAFI